MPDGSHLASGSNPRDLPDTMAERLIVALDVEDVKDARALVGVLGSAVRFYKIGFWLFFKRGVNELIDDLIKDGKRVFLDYKMFDIPESVKRGVESAVERGISFITVHGDTEIMKAAVDARSKSSLKILSVSVLTSLDDQALSAMGYGVTVKQLIEIRVRGAVECGCDGIIASPNDRPDELRNLVKADNLLIVTPGIRMPEDTLDDHARAGSPADAIFNGADYLVVGRPIVRNAAPRQRAEQIIAEMKKGQDRRGHA